MFTEGAGPSLTIDVFRVKSIGFTIFGIVLSGSLLHVLIDQDGVSVWI